MTNLRSYAIARRRFVGDGTRMEQSAWELRRAKILEELKEDLPSLRSLHATALDVLYEITDQGVTIEARLTEIPQLSLFFGRSSTADPYIQDINRVQSEQRQLREDYEWALKSQDLPSSPQMTSRRQRMWRARGTGSVELCSSIESDWMELPRLSKIMPQAMRIEFRALVLRLERNTIQVMLLEDIQIAQSGSLDFHRGTKLTMTRGVNTQGLEAGVRLLTSIEKNQPITIEAAVELSWVNGRPEQLTALGLDQAMKSTCGE